MSSYRWVGRCTRCHHERQLESRERHAMWALCDGCAAKPPPVDIFARPAMVTGDARRIEVTLSAGNLARLLVGRRGMGVAVLALTLDHNRVRCSPPIPDEEVAVIVGAAVKEAQG